MRRIVIASLILVVLSPTMAFAAAWYRCAVDSQVRAACCCPGESDEEKVSSDAAPEVQAACCCEIEAAEASASQVRIAVEGGSAALSFTWPRSVVEVQSPQLAAELRPVHEVARPSSRAPPLFLANCSLLI